MSNFERAQVARFAYEEAQSTGSLDCIKAICYVLRNRLKNGWGNTWLEVMIGHANVEGNLSKLLIPLHYFPVEVQAGDRLLQLIVRDIDDIYMGQSQDDTKTVVQDALYWQFVDRPASQWFTEHIVRDPVNHPRIAQVGPIVLFR